VDHKISNNNTLFARVGFNKSNDDVARGALKEGYGGFNFLGHHPGYNVVVSDTHNFSPTILNEAKLTYTRDSTNLHDLNFGKSVDLGIQGIAGTGTDPAIGGLPDFGFGSAIPFEGVGSWPNSIRDAQNTYELIDNLSWYTGRHAFKMGINVRRYQNNDETKPPELRGSYFFDDQLSGLAYANFLLGYPTVAWRTTPRPNAYVRSTHYAFYFQDDLKINQRITFNFGLRYEYQTPWVDKFDRLFWFCSGDRQGGHGRDLYSDGFSSCGCVDTPYCLRLPGGFSHPESPEDRQEQLEPSSGLGHSPLCRCHHGGPSGFRGV